MDQLETSVSPGTGELPAPSSLRLTARTFWSPGPTFGVLASSPRWLVPFVLCCLVLFVHFALTEPYRLNDLRDQVRGNSDYSQEERQRRLENIERMAAGRFTLKSGLQVGAYTVAAQGFRLLGIAFFVWLAFQLYRKRPTFRHVAAVCSFSYLVLIPEYMLRLALAPAKQSNKLFFGPAALLSPSAEDTLLFSVLKAIDLFDLWMILLIGIGLSVVVETSRLKASLTVAYLWVIWSLIGIVSGGLVRVS